MGGNHEACCTKCLNKLGVLKSFSHEQLGGESELRPTCPAEGLAGAGYLASNAMYTVDAGHMSLEDPAATALKHDPGSHL